MFPNNQEWNVSFPAIRSYCLISRDALLLHRGYHWKVFSASMPVAAIDLDQRIACLEVD